MTDKQWQYIIAAFARIESEISKLKSQLDSVERDIHKPGGQTQTTIRPS